MPRQSLDPSQVATYLHTGVRSAADIQQRFGCSQPTVSRCLAQLGALVVPLGQGRARRYTALRDVRSLGGEFSVYTIDAQGNAQQHGQLLAVAQDQFLWRPVHGTEQLFDSLPWFLADLRPEGFVGRAFVRRMHEELRLPLRLDDWSEDHVLTALARRGEDTIGNLIIGVESLERYFKLTKAPPPPIPSAEVAGVYPQLAVAALGGQAVGSSAGGEQPKFTTGLERNGTLHQVLVKFSPPIDSIEGRRWADLLICEHLALEIVREQTEIKATQSRIIEAGQFLFLELERFDRSGRFGRLPLVSLRAVDNEFFGHQDNWINASHRLQQSGRLSADEAALMRTISVFGIYIGNNDQHFGNISLVMGDEGHRCSLAPVYDVLPMFYRPMNGMVHGHPLDPPLVIQGVGEEGSRALHLALHFWAAALEDVRLSPPFRQLCQQNLAILQQLHQGPRLLAG
jgi:hypothetical protein